MPKPTSARPSSTSIPILDWIVTRGPERIFLGTIKGRSKAEASKSAQAEFGADISVQRWHS